MALKEDLKTLNLAVQQMEAQISIFDDLADTSIKDSYGLDIRIKDKISSMSKEEIEALDEADAKRLLHETCDDDKNIKALESRYESLKDEEEIKGMDFYHFIIKDLLDIKTTLSEIDDLRNEKDKIMSDAEKIYENYFNYINTPEYKEKKKKLREELYQKAEAEENEFEKKKILRKLDAIEKAENLSFLIERLESQGEKEAANEVDIFFHNNRSTTVTERFNKKLPKYGLNPEIYKKFLNFEETFLPEEYHDLNNMFLFHVMRYVGYTDTYDERDGLFVNSILVKMYNLVYHRFSSDEDEKAFIEFVKKVDDYFMPYIETFKKSNVTSPNHPERQKRDKEFAERQRSMIITALKQEGVEVNENLDTDTLRHQLKDVVDAKNAEAEKELAKSENELDTSTELTGANLKVGDIEDIVNKVESSPELDELDKMAEEMGGTLVPEKEVIEPFKSIEENKTEVNATTETLEKAIDMVESSPEMKELEKVEKDAEETVSIGVQELKKSEAEKQMATVVDEENMIVKRQTAEHVIEATDEDLASLADDIEVEIDAYVDEDGNMYIDADDSGEYKYCDSKGEIILEDRTFTEVDVLRLASIGAVSKKRVTI